MINIHQIASLIQRSRDHPAVLATVVDIEGSSYRRLGARLLFLPDGSRTGSISGGCLESDLAEHAKRLIQSANHTILVTYDTSSENDLLWGIGTGCHGVIRILLEKLESTPTWATAILSATSQRRSLSLFVDWRGSDDHEPAGTLLLPNSSACLETVAHPPVHLVIFGAGPDVSPLVQLAQTIGWEVTVWNSSTKGASTNHNETLFSGANILDDPRPADAIRKIRWDQRTVAAVMTHRYHEDLTIINLLSKITLPYLGLLGPKSRGDRILAEIGLQNGRALINLHNPIGLDLGGEGPAAIALSIVSEIQCKLTRHSGESLRDCNQPIHGSRLG